MMNIAVIFAGGVGRRMHSREVPKQFLRLHDKPIIIHTLEVFEKSPEIDSIVVSCLKNYIGYLNDLIHQFNLNKVQAIVPGGSTGQESIYNGLVAAAKIGDRNKDIVLIHDGVRPLINEATIKNNIDSVKEHGSAITSVKAKETILVVDDKESIDNVPDRSHSRLARAPQSFYLDDILSAHEQAIKEGRDDFIDSCSMMTYYGHRLYLIQGPQENIKVTTPDDFYIMRALLDAKEDYQIYGLDDKN
ncbi:IspD/TarI family cytidylyltransferase [Limosilactobacillus vaginalis]|uniref:IspD/TarI family cytidylyltransferase n=1 Tax=Limosilactobacillus vaginalis TaxID=1633 RepID=UPI0025A4AB9A|nr:IspD/TarI family cytidylyltransferase [Limosilactobacillus vaginalis]MDM8222239.1 IspD/TarI family cytidylyltransferase [Limosilactobacillus vaginalis]MDM8264756.1 IspD/TarI family cytidylyltransferase [Limosilactobacillus vaginalis]